MEQTQSYGLKDFILFVSPILVGGLCVLLWWYELHYTIGWQGMGWLRKPILSVYLIIFLVVAVFLLPMMVELKMPIPWVLFYVVLLYATSWLSFFTAKDILRHLYTQGLHAGDQYLIAISIWKLMGVVIAASVIFFIPMRHFHKTTDGMHVLTIIVAMISVIPASIISIENLPLWDCKVSFIEAVKVGYPIFWLTVFLGGLSTAAAKEII